MPVITVSQLNNYMKRYVDRNIHLSDLWIKGEISNFKRHYSGHIYMTLKDENSCMKAVMFKFNACNLKFNPADGMKVVAFGKISVYEKDGTYQLYTESMIPDGVGELYAAYEQLKEQLAQEGLFDEVHKKPLPTFPQSIGVITSISGAALRDILHVLHRRYPLCKVCIYPAKVQGIGSSQTIMDGIAYFSNEYKPDVIIIARGGGSIEDLWAFNEEKLAYAIYDCDIPIISGVGHETDFTIADFVSDKRAPTPSAAAEIAVPSATDLKSFLKTANTRMRALIDQRITQCSERLKVAVQAGIFSRPYSIIEEKSQVTDNALLRLNAAFDTAISGSVNQLIALNSSLEAMNPLQVLKRGYAWISDRTGNTLHATDIHTKDVIHITFSDGKVKCVVSDIAEDK